MRRITSELPGLLLAVVAWAGQAKSSHKGAAGTSCSEETSTTLRNCAPPRCWQSRPIPNPSAPHWHPQHSPYLRSEPAPASAYSLCHPGGRHLAGSYPLGSPSLFVPSACEGAEPGFPRLVRRETPRLCRGGSGGLTNTGVHRGNSLT